VSRRTCDAECMAFATSSKGIFGRHSQGEGGGAARLSTRTRDGLVGSASGLEPAMTSRTSVSPSGRGSNEAVAGNTAPASSARFDSSDFLKPSSFRTCNCVYALHEP
jgi:hypothetical protein